jgi:hypothetical protein
MYLRAVAPLRRTGGKEEEQIVAWRLFGCARKGHVA